MSKELTAYQRYKLHEKTILESEQEGYRIGTLTGDNGINYYFVVDSNGSYCAGSRPTKKEAWLAFVEKLEQKK